MKEKTKLNMLDLHLMVELCSHDLRIVNRPKEYKEQTKNLMNKIATVMEEFEVDLKEVNDNVVFKKEEN